MPSPNLPRDASADPIQVLRPSSLSQRVTLTAGPDQAAPLNDRTRVVRISGDSNVFYTANGAATTSDPFLAAGAYEYIAVRKNDRPQFLDPLAGGGFINVTEME